MSPRMARLAASVVLMAAVAWTRDARASGLADFARCVARAGAVYYTAEWCPYCARQNRMFGAALRYLRVVDCTRGCNGITGFPTWRFADGTRTSGIASLEMLAQRTGCRLDGTGEGPPGDEGAIRSSGPGTRTRREGGVEILEVR